MWCFFFSYFLIVIERKELSVNSNTDCVNGCLFRWNSLNYTLAEDVKINVMRMLSENSLFISFHRKKQVSAVVFC